MKYLKLYKILGISLFLLFIIFLIINLCGDKRPNSGFLGNINNIVTYKDNKTIDKISDVLLYLSFVVVLYAAVIGILELIKNKSLFKVSRIIIVFAIISVIAVIIWILCDKILHTSYRPLEDENSFPSTHVFIFTYFILMSNIFIKKYIKNELINKIIFILLIIISITLMPSLRILAGKHYITDTIGGITLGFALYFLTVGFGYKETIENEKIHYLKDEN